MLISHRWLCELLPGLKLSPSEIAENLTRAGLAVDGLRPFGTKADTIVVAQVKALEPHPSRSGLRLVRVDRGGVEQVVVCGASNVPDPGGLVVLALLGTTLPAVGITLEPRKIGGVLSEGMLCSEKELGLADVAEGILILEPNSAVPGQPFHDACPHGVDTILDIDVTPNRPDALGHIGVARDLAATMSERFVLPPIGLPRRVGEGRVEDFVQVENRDPERCPRYSAAVVRGVQIQPSPLWMQWRLNSLGVRPISNVVDITNFLLLEAGQPMHAFDSEKLAGHRIVVRRAEPGEAFRTLDEVDRKLDADDLVIADAKGAVALAGIMGGADSEIHADTRDVILECAYFSPRGIRRAARRHSMHTESSHRFERGTDWGNIEWVIERAKVLLSELAEGHAIPGALHLRSAELVLPSMQLRSARLNAVLGIDVPFEQAKEDLSRLGFQLEDAQPGIVNVKGASWRPDVSREIDLIEEVARMITLENIPTVLPAIPPQRPRTAHLFEREVCQVAASLGLSEALTYAFVSPGELEAIRAPKAVVKLSNPLTEERSVMRTSLLPGLLEAVKRAHRRGQTALRLFSVGPVFLPVPDGDVASLTRSRPRLDNDVGVLPEERPMLAVALAGPRPMHLSKPESTDIYDAKAVAVELVERITRKVVSVEHAGGDDALAHLHPRGAARLLIDQQVVGHFGPLHPSSLDALDLEIPVFTVEIDLAALERIGQRVPRYAPLARLPAVVRDIALELPETILAGAVESLIASAAGELCESVELFDLFTGGSLPEGYRSLAFRVTYRDPLAATSPDQARTLTDKEVDACHSRIVAAAKQQLGANLRG